MKQILTAALAAGGLFAASSASAETLEVTFVVVLKPGVTATATWDQASNPTPITSFPGAVTEIPIFNFKSDIWATPVAAYYQPVGAEYQFTLDQGVNWIGSQLYTGSESAPQFSDGAYNGTIESLGYTSTLTFESLGADAPEPATWALMGLGFCGLGFIRYRTSRGAISRRIAYREEASALNAAHIRRSSRRFIGQLLDA